MSQPPVPLRVIGQVQNCKGRGDSTTRETSSFEGFFFFFFMFPVIKVWNLAVYLFLNERLRLQVTWCSGYLDSAGSFGTCSVRSLSLSETPPTFIFASFSHPVNIPLWNGNTLFPSWPCLLELPRHWWFVEIKKPLLSLHSFSNLSLFSFGETSCLL